MGVGNREKNFEKYMERHFGIQLPENVSLFYARGVRIGSKQIKASDIHGELGYAACDFGFNPTNSFIQNFGHLARKNIVNVEEKIAKDFAFGKGIRLDLGIKSKHVIVKYGRHIIGLGFYDHNQKKIISRIPEKRRREIINDI